MNPPTTSWWGGFWERIIGPVERLLKRVLGSKKLYLRQIENLIFEIETMVTTQSLNYISPDLTLAHFLNESKHLKRSQVTISERNSLGILEFGQN